MIVALPTLALPRTFMLGVLRGYARSSFWLLRVVCGSRSNGADARRLPTGPCIVACKHQSLWETFALFMLLADPTYVLKRELMWLPLFGWLATKARMIPIDRGSHAKALGRYDGCGAREAARGRQIVIFPEGTRRPPGAEPRYLPGVAFLYAETGLPCVPSRSIPDCSGRAARCGAIRAPSWSKCSTRSPPGLDKRAFLTRLQYVSGEATARLVAEGRARDRNQELNSDV